MSIPYMHNGQRYLIVKTDGYTCKYCHFTRLRVGCPTFQGHGLECVHGAAHKGYFILDTPDGHAAHARLRMLGRQDE